LEESNGLELASAQLEGDFLQGYVLIGQGVMALNGKRVDLDYM